MRTFRKDSFDYSSIVDFVVDMKPVDVRAGPISAGRRRSSIISRPADSVCVFCLENVSFQPHIRCLECKRTEVFICVPCFQLGSELGEHRRGHNYEVIYRCGPPVFHRASNEGPQWGLLEDQRLLSLIRTYKIDDWPKIALTEFGRKRTVDEALTHFSRCFLNGIIGEIVMEGMKRPPIHAFGLGQSEIYTGEFFKPVPVDFLKQQIREAFSNLANGSQILNNVEFNEKSAVRPIRSAHLEDTLENMICEFSHVHVEHSPIAPSHLSLLHSNRCFIHDRLTHLHKAPKSAQPNGHRRFGNMKAPLNFLDEDDDSRMSHSLVDNNFEAEDHSPEPESPVNRYSFRDKRQRTAPNKLSNGAESPTHAKARGANNGFSPSPPSSPRHHHERNKRRQEASEESEEDEEDDDETQHGYGIRDRGTKRQRELLSYSPPKVRNRSSSRRKRRKLVFSPRRRIAKAKRRVRPKSTTSNKMAKGANQRRNSRALNARQLESMYFAKEELLLHRLTHPMLNYAGREIHFLTKTQTKKFDSDDLNLIAYNPKRDDFEHEYRNAAEHLISKIFLNGECLSANELEQFKNAVRVARVHRYNRVVERRYANHSIIREHQLLNEFFSIVKTNVNERGKYALFAADSFPFKKRAEECRPYFAKLRRVLPSEELSNLVEDIAEMETLMNRIRTLRSLQTAGITEIKGRLKSELSISFRNRKRKARKPDNGELRRAALRWKRIKGWSKRVNNDETN